MTVRSTTRIAIVGDKITDSRYRAIIGRVPGAELTAVATGVDALLDRSAAQFDAAIVTESLARLDRLAQAGKHVLLAGTPTDSVLPVIAAFQQSDANLTISTPLRFRADIAAVKQSLDSGELGDPGLLRIHRWQRSDERAESLLLDELDLAVWFFGTRPTSIYALRRSIAGSDDYTQVHLGFPSDGMAMIDVYSSLPAGNSYRSLSMIGSSGAAYADDHHNMQLVYQGDRPSAVRTNSDRDVLLAQLLEFVDSIQASRRPQVDGESWQAIMSVGNAIEASKESGRAVRLCGDEYELV